MFSGLEYPNDVIDIIMGRPLVSNAVSDHESINQSINHPCTSTASMTACFNYLF